MIKIKHYCDICGKYICNSHTTSAEISKFSIGQKGACVTVKFANSEHAEFCDDCKEALQSFFDSRVKEKTLEHGEQ